MPSRLLAPLHTARLLVPFLILIFQRACSSRRMDDDEAAALERLGKGAVRVVRPPGLIDFAYPVTPDLPHLHEMTFVFALPLTLNALSV